MYFCSGSPMNFFADVDTINCGCESLPVIESWDVGPLDRPQLS